MERVRRQQTVNELVINVAEVLTRSTSLQPRAALAELCMAYWYSLDAFIRRKGHDPDEALGLTCNDVTQLLETGVLASADHRLGRFRASLQRAMSRAPRA